MAAKSIAEKLLIKPNSSLWISDPSRLDLINPLPDQVRLVDGPGEAATALVFAADSSALRTVLDDNKDDLTTPAIVWIAYPKANRTDINRDTLWPIVAEYGLRPNGQVAIDEVWSALRFRATREGEAPLMGGGQ